MSNRELVIDLVSKMPEDAPLEEIAREIQFVAGINHSLAQADRGEVISIEEVERLVERGLPNRPDDECRQGFARHCQIHCKA